MAYVDEPALTPTLWRDNAYLRNCECCLHPVPAEQGRAFLLWDAAKKANTWRAIHNDCVAPYQAGLATSPAPLGSIVAKQVQQQAEAETLMTTLASAPAFTMPDAAALEPLLAKLMADIASGIVTDVAHSFTETVPAMVAELLASARPVAISVNNAPSITLASKHKDLEDVLLMVMAGASPYIVGPAGSGKTTLAKQIAKVLDRPFYLASRVSSEYKLTGFVDANGKTTRTAFREAYEHGGVFLLDEVDASDPDALTAFNAALANDAGEPADFPDGAVLRHPDFVAIAAGNTFGRGADRQYVGRNQLDAATLDRFQIYEVGYDEQLEFSLAGNDEWTAHVQRVRAAIDAEKVRHVVSPRASITGAKLLAAGMPRAKVEECCIWKGMELGQRTRVVARMVRPVERV